MIKKEKEETLKNKVCRNDYQKSVWDLGKKNSLCNSASEFWSFFNAVDVVLSMNDKFFKELQKHRKDCHK